MRSWLLLMIVLLIGCGKPASKGGKQVIAMDTVPPIVIKAAQTSQPDVKFDTVIRADGFYEVRGKNPSGKVVEVEVNDAGEVLQVE